MLFEVVRQHEKKGHSGKQNKVLNILQVTDDPYN